MKDKKLVLDPKKPKSEVFSSTPELIDLEMIIHLRLAELMNRDETLYVVNRDLDGVSMLDVFKNSLFEYIDGYLLIDRFYKEHAVTPRKLELERFSKKYLDIAKRLEEASEKASEKDEVDKDIQEELGRLTQEFNNMSDEDKFETTPVEVMVKKNRMGLISEYLMANIKEYPKEWAPLMAASHTLFIHSFASNILGFLGNEYIVEIKGIEYEDYIDVVANIMDIKK